MSIGAWSREHRGKGTSCIHVGLPLEMAVGLVEFGAHGHGKLIAQPPPAGHFRVALFISKDIGAVTSLSDEHPVLKPYFD